MGNRPILTGLAKSRSGEHLWSRSLASGIRKALQSYRKKRHPLDHSDAALPFAFSVALSDDAIAQLNWRSDWTRARLLCWPVGGRIFLYAHHSDRAITQLRKTLEIDPNFWMAHRRAPRACRSSDPAPPRPYSDSRVAQHS